MPLIQGHHIRDAANSKPYADRIAMMIEVLDAVAHAHSSDVLHRDLKPSNILVRTSDNQPVIVDFGLSYLLDLIDGESLTTTAVGSIGYIPSEVLANPKHRSPKHDIFSCGVITYEIIASRRPDPQNYESLANVDASLAVFDNAIRNALNPSSTRFSEARSFRDALTSALVAHRDAVKT